MTKRRCGRQCREKRIHRMRAIEDALACNPPAVDVLRDLAIYGFENDELRRKVWPLLLGVDHDAELSGESVGAHAYSDIVEKDVDRSLHNYDISKAFRKVRRDHLREELTEIINYVFLNHPELHYVQGFHDICSVMLLVCGKRLGMIMTERLSQLHIRDALRDNLSTIVTTLQLIFPLLAHADREVFHFFQNTNVQPFISLSWVLTWFSHDLKRFSDVCRIFDFLLASHALMPVYLAVSLFIQCRKQLLVLEPEMSEVHRYFQDLPNDLNIPEILFRTRRLFHSLPPQELIERGNAILPRDSPLHIQNPEHIARIMLRDEDQYANEKRKVVMTYVVPVVTLAASFLMSQFFSQ